MCRDELVISAGSEAGALLVDGQGDGVFLEAPDQDFEFLRTTAFGMLQGCRMRNTKTVCVPSSYSSACLKICGIWIRFNVNICVIHINKSPKFNSDMVEHSSTHSDMVDICLANQTRKIKLDGSMNILINSKDAPQIKHLNWNQGEENAWIT